MKGKVLKLKLFHSTIFIYKHIASILYVIYKMSCTIIILVLFKTNFSLWIEKVSTCIF